MIPFACRVGWHNWRPWAKYGEPRDYVRKIGERDSVTEERKWHNVGVGTLHTQRRECSECGREQLATRRVE